MVTLAYVDLTGGVPAMMHADYQRHPGDPGPP